VRKRPELTGFFQGLEILVQIWCKPHSWAPLWLIRAPHCLLRPSLDCLLLVAGAQLPNPAKSSANKLFTQSVKRVRHYDAVSSAQ
jgi:hypothetical protein